MNNDKGFSAKAIESQNDSLWLDLQEIGNLESVSRRKIHINISRDIYPQDKIRSVPSRGPRGEKYQVHITALSKAAQDRFWADRTASLDNQVESIIAKQVEAPAPAGKNALAEASAKERRDAARKAVLLQSFNELDSTKAKRAFAQRHRVPLSSLYRWQKQYDGTAASLIRKWEGRKPSRIYKDAKRVAIDLYLRPERPTPDQVLRALKAKFGKDAPARRTVYQWLADEDLLGGRGSSTYLRWGEKVYRDKYEPVRRRDWSLIPSNHTWVGDHHEFDVMVICPDGTIGRPWLTAWQDGHSRAITGYTLNQQPNSLEIGLALKDGILPSEGEPYRGIPQQLYVDNGKDYRCKLLNGDTVKVFRQEQTDPVWGLYGHLGIKTRFCEPYHGKSKPIERFFRTLESGWVCLMRGYCGRSPQYRPEQLADDIKKTKLWLESKGAMGERRLMTWWEAEEEFAAAIHAYGNRPHSALKKLDGRFQTPAESYVEGLPAAVRMPDPETLDLLILPAMRRKVRNDGIWVNGQTYHHPDLYPLIGQTVEIRKDPRDDSKVLVIHKGKFAAWAELMRPVTPFAETEEEIDELTEFLRGNAARRAEYRRRRKALLAENPLAAMTPETREPLEGAGADVIAMPHVTGYDRAVRAASKARRDRARKDKPATAEQAKAVGELMVWEFERSLRERRTNE